MPTLIPSERLAWKGTTLTFGKRKVISIVPDDKYSGMWRVKHPDGRLSDMVNRTRAKDAALSIAMRILNGEQEANETSGQRPPIDYSGPGAPR